MAIVKHMSSHNADYDQVLDYLTLKHKEVNIEGKTHYELILDEYGLPQERDNCAVTYINARGEECVAERWASACMSTNLLYGKNRTDEDRKQHIYIISHPAEDRERMTMDDLLEEGRDFVRENFPGYDCLIAVHRDTDNDHIHVSLNSVRALERDEQPWMMRDKNGNIRPSELEAGGKHQDSPMLRRHLNDWLLEYTQQHGYVAKDNNAIADENRVKRHGSKNDQMREALLDCAGRSRDMKELRQLMKQDYDMDVKVSSSGKTISVLYPGNEKYVRLRSLDLEPADLTRRMQGEQYNFDAQKAEEQRRKEFEAAEKKKYVEWVRESRQKNNEKAEKAILASEEQLRKKLKAKGERYRKEDYQDLNYLIRQNRYLESNLQTELERIDKLLNRWEQYQDSNITGKEHWSHGSYVRWCGCDPDNALELDDLKAQREVVIYQQQMAVEMQKALNETAEQWRGHNELEYAMNDLAWKKNRELSLKQQIKYQKKRQKELLNISVNCKRAYDRTGSPKNLASYQRVNSQWLDAALKQKECEEKLREVKQQKKDAKKRVKAAKKTVKELNR